MSTIKPLPPAGEPPAPSKSRYTAISGSRAFSQHAPEAGPATPPVVPRQPVAPGDPYCGNCGYLLKDLTDASKCPECGRPLVDVLVRGRSALAGKQRRFRTESMMFGVPIIDLCIGIDEHGKVGRAKGIIAIGDFATGFIAVGNKWATGGVAIGGGGSLGVCAVGGGCSIGLLTALGGGLGLGGIAFGGCGAGGFATGGVAIGAVAQGGAAIGYYARGGTAVGAHTIGNTGASSQHATEVFTKLEPYIGRPGPGLSMLTPIMILGAIDFIVLGVLLILALVGHRRWTSLSNRPA